MTFISYRLTLGLVTPVSAYMGFEIRLFFFENPMQMSNICWNLAFQAAISSIHLTLFAFLSHYVIFQASIISLVQFTNKRLSFQSFIPPSFLVSVGALTHVSIPSFAVM